MLCMKVKRGEVFSAVCGFPVYTYPSSGGTKALNKCFQCETGFYYPGALLINFGYSSGIREDFVDCEVQASEVAKDSIDVIFLFDEEEDLEPAIYVQLQTKNEVCFKCGGKGKHTNPAIDGNGITSSEMDELGEEFFQNYMSGVYDVTCYECKGNNVVTVIDEDSISYSKDTSYRQAYFQYLKWQEEEADYQAMVAAERRAGC